MPGEGTTLAIDNIQFNNCGIPAPRKGDCPSNQIKCKNNVCMTPYGLCDNLNDCGDVSDESGVYCSKLTMYCTFEQGTPPCNDTQEFDSGSTNLWSNMTTINANPDQNMLRMTGPTTDHTIQLPKR